MSREHASSDGTRERADWASCTSPVAATGKARQLM